MPCDGDPHSCMDWSTGGRKRDSEGQWMGGEIHSLAFKRAESIHFSVGIVSFQSKSTSFKRIPPANISLLTLSPRNCSGQMLNWWGTPLTTQKAPFVVARLRQTFLMSHVLHQACTTRGGRGERLPQGGLKKGLVLYHAPLPWTAGLVTFRDSRLLEITRYY